MPFPPKSRPTHQWLQPVLAWLEGKNPYGLTLGSPTGVIGLYGVTGLPRITAAGAGQLTGASGAGLASGLGFYNGGTGTPYTVNDVVKALKNLSVLPL